MKTLQQTYSRVQRSTEVHRSTETKRNILLRFFDWCEAQQKNRLAWLAFIITGHGCVFTPITILFIILTGNQVIFWPFAIAAMTIPLVSNLAALPTKITVPLFFLSILIDLVIIANCLAIGFHIPPSV